MTAIPFMYDAHHSMSVISVSASEQSGLRSGSVHILSSTNTATRSVASFAGLLAVLLSSTGMSAQDTPATAEPVRAIWRTQHLDFRFRSEQQRFKCEEFAVRLQRILRAMGAHLNAATELRCTDAFSGIVTGRIVMTAPIEATDENVRRVLTDITPADKLAARLNGRPDPATRIRVFPAEWRRVSSMKANLDGGDCELVRAVKRQLLPALSVRDAQISTSCTSRSVPKLSALALVRIEGSAVDGDARKPSVVTAGAECNRDGSDAPCDESEESEPDAEALPAGG